MSMVRSDADYFLSKISRPAYLKLRTVPIERRYRFILSDLTHEEYSFLKADFVEDVDFLRLSDRVFQSLISVAFRNGFQLEGFEASGKGYVRYGREETKWDHARTYSELTELADRQVKAYVLNLGNGTVSVTARKDLNFFVTRADRESAKLVFLLATDALSQSSSLFNELSGFKLRVRNNGHGPEQIKPIIFSGSGQEIEASLDRLKSEFNVRPLLQDPIDSVLILQDKRLLKSYIRIVVRRPFLIAVPEIRTNLESVIGMVEALESAGGARVA
jgi:hypothetical protein